MHRPDPFRRFTNAIYEEYEWVHITLGLIGNLTFFAGSILFLWEHLKTAGTWLFIIGAFLMLIGSLGNAIVRYVASKRRERRQ